MLRACLAALAAGVLLLPAHAASSAPPVGNRFVVGFTSRGYAGAAALEAGIGAKVIGKLEAVRADVWSLDGQDVDTVLAALRSDPRVRYAEIDGVVHALRVPNDEFLSTQWSVPKVRAEQAWDLSTGSRQVVVGVIDTGVDATHPDLAGKLVSGYDYVNNDADPSDDNGHGTAVAGIIGANSDNQIGVAGYCWACRLMPVKVLDADGTGFVSALAQGILWATDHGAKVINLSLGGPDSEAVLAAAAQYAEQHGVLVVAAAGNEGSLALDFPAALPGVLSVGASDKNDQLYSFSNSAALVAAPGENSATAHGGGYVWFLGTSSAAPVVSGLAGLAFSLVPGATVAQVERAIESTAVPIPGVVAGRVDAYAALRALAPGLSQPPAAGPAKTPGSKSESGAGRSTRQKKVVEGRLASRGSRRIVVVTGAGSVQATVRLRAGSRVIVRLRLFAGTRMLASGQGRGTARLRARVKARAYRLVVSSNSRRALSFALTVSYPAAGS